MTFSLIWFLMVWFVLMELHLGYSQSSLHDQFPCRRKPKSNTALKEREIVSCSVSKVDWLLDVVTWLWWMTGKFRNIPSTQTCLQQDRWGIFRSESHRSHCNLQAWDLIGHWPVLEPQGGGGQLIPATVAEQIKWIFESHSSLIVSKPHSKNQH